MENKSVSHFNSNRVELEFKLINLEQIEKEKLCVDLYWVRISMDST